MWNEPKVCTKGVPLPPRRSSPCEAIALWLMIVVGAGAFVAVLLSSLTCYFWKKNQRLEEPEEQTPDELTQKSSSLSSRLVFKAGV